MAEEIEEIEEETITTLMEQKVNYDDGKITEAQETQLMGIITKPKKWDYSKNTGKPYVEAHQVWVDNKLKHNKIGKIGEIAPMILSGQFDLLQKNYLVNVRDDWNGDLISIACTPKKYKNNITSGYRISYYMALMS